MPNKETRSHVRNGNGYYKHTGRYNEVIPEARHRFENNASPAKDQNLVSKGKNSAAASTLKKVWKELGY